MLLPLPHCDREGMYNGHLWFVKASYPWARTPKLICRFLSSGEPGNSIFLIKELILYFEPECILEVAIISNWQWTIKFTAAPRHHGLTGTWVKLASGMEIKFKFPESKYNCPTAEDGITATCKSRGVLSWRSHSFWWEMCSHLVRVCQLFSFVFSWILVLILQSY